MKSANSIREYIELYDDQNTIDSMEHVLKVSRSETIYDIDDIIVSKGEYQLKKCRCRFDRFCNYQISGSYDGIPVAIKITSFDTFYNQELSIFEALNAIDDPNAESHGIPQVYYRGLVFGKYNAIAMSLFEETVEHRWTVMKKPFSDFSVLQIFKQAVNKK